MKDLKSELSKNLERLIIGLMLTPAEFDAKMMRKAMEVQYNHLVTGYLKVHCWICWFIIYYKLIFEAMVWIYPFINTLLIISHAYDDWC